MMKRKMKLGWRAGMITIVAVVGNLAVGEVWAQATTAQKAAPGKAPAQMQAPQQQMVVPGLCTTADKVAATDLTLNPAKPTWLQAVVVTLTIKNLCNVPLSNIGWQIASTPDNTILGSGTWQASVAPSQTFTVTAPWRAAPGERGFDGRADPAGALKESADDRKNNVKTLSVTVPVPTQAAAPAMETQILNFAKAKEAGASVTNTLLPGAPAGCSNFGVDESESMRARDDTIAFLTQCAGLGATATGEAFANFKLKNGWKIKPAPDGVVLVRFQGVSWQYRLRPQEGTNDPHMNVEVTAPAGLGGARYIGEVVIRINIEGPAGTSPYLGPVVNR